MRNILPVLFLVFYCLSSSAQSNPKRIKVILLGTFHFNQSLDSASKLHSNLFSAKRQQEVSELVGKLVKQKPDKIFLEFTEKNQPFYDSVYRDYLNGREPAVIKTRANEIFQLGMKTAKQLGHKKVYGMNYQPLELIDSGYVPKNIVDKAVRDLYLALDQYNDSLRSNPAFYNLPYPYTLPNLDSLLQRKTLTEFFLELNSPRRLQRADYNEWRWFQSVGTGNNMSVLNYVGTFWYGTNLMNFNHVLRQTDYARDNCYVIIYGSNHIPFLKHLFEIHPYFEVMEVEKALK